jgi:hypothetical protein
MGGGKQISIVPHMMRSTLYQDHIKPRRQRVGKKTELQEIQTDYKFKNHPIIIL